MYGTREDLCRMLNEQSRRNPAEPDYLDPGGY